MITFGWLVFEGLIRANLSLFFRAVGGEGARPCFDVSKHSILTATCTEGLVFPGFAEVAEYPDTDKP